MAQLKTSIHNYGGTSNNAGSMGTVNLDPYTYNPRYPGFDETNYRKLESKIDALGLTGYEREKAMDEAYQQILPIVQNEIKNSDRREYINQANYEVSQIQDPQAKKEAQGKLTVTELAQKLKETYNLDPSANDEDVFNSWINSIPNGGQLLADYMNDGDRELLYQGGLEQKIEAPETPESTVGGLAEIINQQSQTSDDTALGRANNNLNKFNLIGLATEGLDRLAQKIPTLTYEKQVENLANKMNNLSEDEISNLYNRFTNMIERGSDKKWDTDERSTWELFWDAATGDSDAAARLNTLYLTDYSQAIEGGGVERNQRGSQIWNKVSNGATAEDINQAIDEKDASGISKALAKGSVWTADKMKNLLNFVGGSYGALQNYAEALGAGSQALKDIKQGRSYVPQNLENNSEAFNAFVADQVANFGEYLTDAPDTLLGKPVDPNAVKFFTNIPQSFIKTLTAKVRGKTNPVDTKIGLAKILFTEEGQQALINRYGSPEALANAMNTDPVGLASDMLDRADKFNLVLNKTTGGLVERQGYGDVTDVLSDKIAGAINVGLNRTSNWLNNKGFRKSAGATDIIKDAAFNPGNVANDIAKEAGMVARDVADAPVEIQAWAREMANRKIQNINRMTKGQQEKFTKMSGGIDQGEFQNQRGLKDTEDLANYLTKNLEQVDAAMEGIQGRWKSPKLDVVVEDVLNYALDTEDPRVGRMQELYNKNKEGGLEMSEINEIKRFYERTNIFDYLKDTSGSKKARTATNRDTALREWQQEVAAEAGLDNLKELNKETQLTKYLLDNASGREKGVKGNNGISLTDWIVASGGGLDANGIIALVGKKIYQTNWFQDKLVDVYNYIGGRELIDTPTVDMSKIQQSNIDRAILAQELAKVQSEADFNNRLKKAEYMAGPALPYNENFNGEPTTTIRVTPEGQSIRQGQISEVNPGGAAVTETTTPKAYTAEELGLENTSLRKIDRSKYIPVEDPSTNEVVFFKVEELQQIPITQNGRRVTFGGDSEGLQR